MDISVSRLNNRMALQVPGELPLGLVFIVGRVESLRAAAEGTVRFELVDAGYRLRCRLPAAVAEETLLKEKDRVRASGHLAFDSHSAQYQLLARDIEVLAAHPRGEDTAQADAKEVQRPAATASLAPTELPPWVRKLAPPEVKEELGLESEGRAPSEDADAAAERQEAGGRATELPPEMVAFLSNAIDSDEEIELTPEMIAEYLPQARQRREGVAGGEGAEAGVAEAAEQEAPPFVAEDLPGAAAGEADDGERAAEEAVGDGGPDGGKDLIKDSGPSPTDDAGELVEKEEPETPRPTVLSPPQGPPRRERRPQPEPQTQSRPLRHYVEYAMIAVLVILIMAALFLAVLLLQT